MTRVGRAGLDWSLDPLDLTMLLERFGRDRLPYPLKYRIEAATGREVAHQRESADRRITRLLDDDLEVATHTLVAPRYRVELLGELADGTVLRSLVAVRDESAVVVVQQPGRNPDTGGTVHLGHTDPEQACRRALSTLPAVPPGSQRPIALARSRTRHSVLDSVDVESSAEQVERMFARPRTGVGAVTIAVGPSIDNRPEDDAQGFFWMDFEADGRYLVESADVITARPASVVDLAGHIDRLVRTATTR